MTKHHSFLQRLHLNQIDTLDAAMATVDAQVQANLGPYRTDVQGRFKNSKRSGRRLD